jgi:hypothetical protein
MEISFLAWMRGGGLAFFRRKKPADLRLYVLETKENEKPVFP